MLYQVYESYTGLLKKTWAWALGGLIGVIGGINIFPMKFPILEIDLHLLWQYLQLLFFAVSGGAATNAGKWLIDYCRERKERAKKPKRTRK